MEPYFRPVCVLHPSDRLEALLRLGAVPPLVVRRVRTVDELREILGSAPAAICITEPLGYVRCVLGQDVKLRDLISAFPLVAFVPALEVGPNDSVLLRTLFAAGVADILDLARETTPLAAARRLREVGSGWTQRLLEKVLPNSIPGRARVMLAIVAEVAAHRGKIEDLAQALGVSERTVPRWFERCRLPPARRVLKWFRLLLMAYQLEDHNRSIESIARACGYSCGASLSSAVRRFLGLTPERLRSAGAFALVSDRFRQELYSYRDRSGMSETDI